MKATESSYARGRGAIIGLAFFFCVAAEVDDVTLRDSVHRLFRQHSYILIEAPLQSPRLLLLPSSPHAAILSDEATKLRQALLGLVDTDPDIREDAILTLSDSDAGAVIDILAGALADPSPLVRDTAAAVLEDLWGLGATGFADNDRPMQ